MSRTILLGVIAFSLVTLIVIVSWPSANPPVVEEKIVEVTVLEEAPVHHVAPEEPKTLPSLSDDSALPKEVDRMAELFNPYPPHLPIVETLSYSGRVDWVTGRAAYLGDYAAHFKTSKHFISRSLHGTGNYLSDVVSKGERFNVLRADKELEFHLVVDLSRLKMWVYYFDKEEDERVLLKAYPICAGRLDAKSRSGSLTPLGSYALGDEIAVYKQGAQGLYRGEAVEMVTVFGERWIPFGREIARCTAAGKGFGIHGSPWDVEEEDGGIAENRESIGSYESNGCIRLNSEDMEELFAVVVSRPSYIHIVKDFTEAELPGNVKG